LQRQVGGSIPPASIAPTAPIGSSVAFLAALPEILWEASLGIYLITKGFKSSPILSDDTRHTGVEGPLIPVVAAR
jgi:hypothetical protein